MTVSLKSWTQAALANRKHWKWLLWILAFEVWLAYEVPTWDLASFTILNKAVDLLSMIAPVIHNFDKAAPYPEGLSLYFAISTLLIIP